jgi:hypothetical protein
MGFQFRDRGHCPNVPVIACVGDATQIGELVQKGRCAQIAELLGDPKADICCPCDQCRIGVGGVPAGQFIGCGRLDMLRGLSAPIRLRRTPRGSLSIWKLKGLEVLGDGLVFGGLCGADDRGVAGAAAQISCQLGVVVRGTVQVGGGHRDGKAGRAKAALAAVVVDHRLLHGVQCAVGRAEAFDGCDGFPVDLGQEQDAAVQGAVARLIADHHAAGTAVAFVAAFFGAGQVFGFAQPVKQGCRWRYAGQRHDFPVEEKSDVHRFVPPRYRSPSDARGSMRRRTRRGQMLIEAMRWGRVLARVFGFRAGFDRVTPKLWA